MHKREFLKSLAWTGLAVSSVGKLLGSLPAVAADSVAPTDGDFWDHVRAGYRLDPDRINLENGYYCIMSEAVREASVRHAEQLNREGSYYLRTRQTEAKAAVRAELAAFAGCATEEVIVTRNTTEALDTVIAGFDWKPGDEAVVAAQDYGSMLDMFAQQVRRHHIITRTVSLPAHPMSDEEIVAFYANALTARTRLLMVCHLVNLTGQILPVRKICDMAHARGVPVMVDGAHSFAHLDFRIPDLGCDYFGTSLHKWLGAPLGLGLLYVKRDRIGALWPLLGDDGYPVDDIRKLNHIGTNPVCLELTIKDALAAQRTLGSARKEARLRSLQRHWTEQARGIKGVTVNTPTEPQRACAIANVAVDRLGPDELAKVLLEKYRIWSVAIDSPKAGVRGVRITPAVFTSMAEINVLVRALHELA